MDPFNLPADFLSEINYPGLEKLKSFNFAVQIDGDPLNPYVGGFNQIGGLGEAVDVREILEGGHPGKHKFPRQAQGKTLTLARGLAIGRFLWDWHRQVLEWTKGKPSYRRTMSIFALQQVRLGDHAIKLEVWTWDIFDAWPSEWIGPEFDSQSEQIAIEKIVIQHSGISLPRSILGGRAGEVLSIF